MSKQSELVDLIVESFGDFERHGESYSEKIIRENCVEFDVKPGDLCVTKLLKKMIENGDGWKLEDIRTLKKVFPKLKILTQEDNMLFKLRYVVMAFGFGVVTGQNPKWLEQVMAIAHNFLDKLPAIPTS